MTCILKDMRQGEGSDGKGIEGQDIPEDWGMTFWRPVVGAFWRTWHIHFGEHVFLRTEGGEMSKWRAMCTELLVENQDLFPRRLYCRDDQTVVRGPLVALGPNLVGPRDLVEKMLISKKKNKSRYA